MKVVVTFNNEDSGELVNLYPGDVTIGEHVPRDVMGGQIATYIIKDGDFDSFMESLDNHHWTYEDIIMSNHKESDL